MKLNLNPIVQNQIFNVYRMNQSAVQKTEGLGCFGRERT